MVRAPSSRLIYCAYIMSNSRVQGLARQVNSTLYNYERKKYFSKQHLKKCHTANATILLWQWIAHDGSFFLQISDVTVHNLSASKRWFQTCTVGNLSSWTDTQFTLELKGMERCHVLLWNLLPALPKDLHWCLLQSNQGGRVTVPCCFDSVMTKLAWRRNYTAACTVLLYAADCA